MSGGLAIALMLLVLYTLLQQTFCDNSETYEPLAKIDAPRNSRSPELENSSSAEQSKSTNARSVDPSMGNDVINKLHGIFQFGDGNGIKIFPQNPHDTPMNRMQGDQSFNDQPSNQEQPFKVQRTADGKLNLVFNDYLLSQNPLGPTATAERRESVIVFPDQLDLKQGQPSCDDAQSTGKTYCLKSRNYPSLTQLDELIRGELPRFKHFFGDDIAIPQNITQRMNTDAEEEYLCTSVEKIIYPDTAQTINSNWLTILNRGDYKQGVRIEECLNEGKPCKFNEFLPMNYYSTCKQQYHYRVLVAISPTGNITTDHFKMPSCCKCVLKHGPH